MTRELAVDTGTRRNYIRTPDRQTRNVDFSTVTVAFSTARCYRRRHGATEAETEQAGTGSAGHRLRPRPCLGGRGPRRDGRPADRRRGPDDAADPRRQGAPAHRRKRAALRLLARDPRRHGAALGTAARAADLLRRVHRERAGDPARPGGRRDVRRRQAAFETSDRQSGKGRTLMRPPESTT